MVRYLTDTAVSPVRKGFGFPGVSHAQKPGLHFETVKVFASPASTSETKVAAQAEDRVDAGFPIDTGRENRHPIGCGNAVRRIRFMRRARAAPPQIAPYGEMETCGGIR